MSKAVIFILILISVIYWGVHDVVNNWQIIHNGVHTDAQVSDRESVRIPSGKTTSINGWEFDATYEVNNKSYTLRHLMRSSYYPSMGDVVCIKYLDHAPEKAKLCEDNNFFAQNRSLWSVFPAVLALVATLLLSLIIGQCIAAIRLSSRIRRIAERKYYLRAKFARENNTCEDSFSDQMDYEQRIESEINKEDRRERRRKNTKKRKSKLK